MNKNKREIIDFLLKAPDSFSIHDFNDYLSTDLKRRIDHGMAIHEVHKQIALLQNFILTLSITLKQRLILSRFFLIQLLFGLFFLVFFTYTALRITTDSQIYLWVLFTWFVVLLTLWLIYWYNKWRAISYVKKLFSELGAILNVNN